MSRVWVVRADGGALTDAFVKGGYASIGWSMGDLTGAKSLDEVHKAYNQQHPNQFPPAAANISSQIHNFMSVMKSDDLIVTPMLDSNLLRSGDIVEATPYFDEDQHHHPNRRKVDWRSEIILRAKLPEQERTILRDRRTIFLLSEQKNKFLALPAVAKAAESPFQAESPEANFLLERIHEKIPAFFELLIAELLKAMGCVDPEVRGGPRDQGVDVYTTVAVPFAGSVAMYVQAKRYRAGRNIDMSVVNKLSKSLAERDIGLVITTSDFKPRVRQRAAETHPQVTLINGSEFAEELLNHWDSLPEYFRDQLGPIPT